MGMGAERTGLSLQGLTIAAQSADAYLQGLPPNGDCQQETAEMQFKHQVLWEALAFFTDIVDYPHPLDLPLPHRDIRTAKQREIYILPGSVKVEWGNMVQEGEQGFVAQLTGKRPLEDYYGLIVSYKKIPETVSYQKMNKVEGEVVEIKEVKGKEVEGVSIGSTGHFGISVWIPLNRDLSFKDDPLIQEQIVLGIKSAKRHVEKRKHS